MGRLRSGRHRLLPGLFPLERPGDLPAIPRRRPEARRPEQRAVEGRHAAGRGRVRLQAPVAAGREAGDRNPGREVGPQFLRHPPCVPQRSGRGRGRRHRDPHLGEEGRRCAVAEGGRHSGGRKSLWEDNHASQRRADSHHPRRQPAARSGAVGPADPRRGGRDGRPAELKRLGEQAVHHVVEQQMACGVDVINDGEQPRVGFQTYVAAAHEGFGGESQAPAAARLIDFPVYAEMLARACPAAARSTNAPQAVADVVYEDLGAAEEECRMFRAALDGLAAQPAETFMTAASPGIIATTMLNAHYERHEAYVFALAREMQQGIRADRARLHPADRCARSRDGAHGAVPRQDRSASSSRSSRCTSRRSTRRSATSRASASACTCCWGNYEGPHTHDVPLRRDPAACSTGRRSARSSHRVRQPAPPARVRARSSSNLPPDSCCCPA